MLEVTTAADVTDLTTLLTVKETFAIANGASDAFLSRQITVATNLICNYLRVSPSTTGSKTLAYEVVRQTLRFPFPPCISVANNLNALALDRSPVVNIVSVVENDVTLAADDYEIDGALIYRLADDVRIKWAPGTIVVSYGAGWLLPGIAAPDENVPPSLPPQIEEGAIALVKHAWYARQRDPLLRSESIPGVFDGAYATPAAFGDGSLPGDVTGLLDPYRRFAVV